MFAISPSIELWRLTPLTVIMDSESKVFSGSRGCGLYISLSSTETIFVNEILVDLSSIVFATGLTTECSCHTNKRFHTGRQSTLCADKFMAVQLSRRIYMYVRYTNSNHAWVHTGSGYFCMAAVLTVPTGGQRRTPQSGSTSASGLYGIWAVQTVKKSIPFILFTF